MKYTPEMLGFIRGCYHKFYSWDRTAALFRQRFGREVYPHLLRQAMERHFRSEMNPSLRRVNVPRRASRQ